MSDRSTFEKWSAEFALIGNVATLSGLLGIVVGLVTCFGAVAAVDPAQKAVVLALGISQAMKCTALGLLVAIPSILAYSVLKHRRD